MEISLRQSLPWPKVNPALAQHLANVWQQIAACVFHANKQTLRIEWGNGMNVIASRAQLRASLLRWSLFTVPLVMLLGFLGGQLGSPATPWFQSLVKPEIYPPPATFGIVWTILYAVIGFSLALVCSAWGARGRGVAIILFIIHLPLNIAWTPVFFGNQDMQGGLIVLALVDITLIAMIWAFWRVRRSAGILLLPYLAWVLFATLLNYQFIQSNPMGYANGEAVETQRFEL